MAIIIEDSVFTLQTKNSTYQMKADDKGQMPQIIRIWCPWRIEDFQEISMRQGKIERIHWIFFHRNFRPAGVEITGWIAFTWIWEKGLVIV